MEYPDGFPPHLRRRAMLTLGTAVGVSVLGTALPNIALPTIAHDLQVSAAASVWVVNAFQIAMTVSLLYAPSPSPSGDWILRATCLAGPWRD